MLFMLYLNKQITTKTTIKIKSNMAYLKFYISKWIFSVFIIFMAHLHYKQNTCAAFEAYFPTSNVRFNLPINEKSESIFSKMPLGQFQVLAATNNSWATDFIYSLEDNDLIRINSSTGEVFMRTDYKSISQSTKYIITALPKSQLKDGKVIHLTLEITPVSDDDYCNDLEQICYWKSAHYNIAEHTNSLTWETFKPVEVGTLGTRPARYLCPILDVKYSLISGIEYFEIHGNQLFTRVPLDHEKKISSSKFNNLLKAGIRCSIKINEKGDKRTFERILNVTLLDRNDNGPELQDEKRSYDFQLDQPYFKENDAIGEKIIFMDKDDMATNAHLSYVIQNDINDLVRPVCNAYEADHMGWAQTVISCQIIFRRNGLLSQPRYCFQLEAIDKTLDAPMGSMKSSKAHICIHSDVSKIHETDHPVALELRQQRKNPRKMYTTDSDFIGGANAGVGMLQSVPVTYEKDVFVYRTATTYNRIAQPENFQELFQIRPTPRFSIIEDRIGAFGITALAGIVFVKDATLLEHAPETVYFLNITWHDTHPRSFVLNVHLVDGRPVNASCELKIKSRSQTCGQIKYQTQCLKFCGLATNGGPCAWRGSNMGFFGRNYASCVPEPKYCPDNICDPLEELNTFACPQDCTLGSRIVGPHTTNDNKRGILSASGTCICEDNNKCSCAPLDDIEPKPKRKRKNETITDEILSTKVHQVSSVSNVSNPLSEVAEEQQTLNVAGFTCGKSCMLIAVTCPLVLIVLVICLIISRRNLRRRVLGKESPESVKKSGAPPDTECDIRNGDLPLVQLDNGFKFETSDSKWEFEREKLKLDVVLGEGEFGKVVKAYATEIAGLRGVTTVAVKMLKKGANSVEYMALLSEFQLLQEVSHPNVIKLLGACTKGNDSPMIIIEYARYGSLRGYLRLSRKIECAGVDFTDGVEPVTALNILTFAWQICKGMAYLTEIKLVHRDLAARNVLLADGKICKISDFGLTRDVYEDDAYLKRSRDRVPVKWMAPESLADHVYTTKSDVWAFGVLCWELISLGASPYPGIPPQNLYYLLKNGYRMERPENCSDEVYSIVRTCWMEEPNARPSFKYLASQFEKLLGNNAKYIELEANAFSNPLYCSDEAALMPTDANASMLNDEVGDPDTLEHLWCPPKISYESQDCTNSRDQSTTFSGSEFLAPPGYDMPRPLIETNTTEQVLRYENDLRFPLNIRKSSITTPSYSNMSGNSTNGICENDDTSKKIPHYSVPVKRGHSYIDMKSNTLIPNNLDNSDFEKHLSKTISFRFSSLLNLKEIEQEQGMV